MSQTTTTIRQAFTLLEVMITSAILVLALAMSLEVIVSSKHLESQAAAQDEIAQEARRLIRVLSSDLTASGWHLPTSEDIDNDGILDAGEDISGNGLIDGITYSNETKTEDRADWYYPYVQIQDSTGTQTSGLGSRFTYAQRPVAAVALPDLPLTLPGSVGDASITLGAAAWGTSFYARSQEIVFLKATIGRWNDATQSYDMRTDTASFAGALQGGVASKNMNFSGANGDLTRADWQQDGTAAGVHDALGVLHASGWEPEMSGGAITGYTERNTDNQPYGVVLDAGWYDGAALGTDDDLTIKVQWETIDAPTMSRADWYQDALREYTYAVVPSPLGLGRLVRAHKLKASDIGTAVDGVEIGNLLAVRAATPQTANWRMRIDRVLSDDVVRIVFDTYRTVDDTTEVTTLSPNQVRIRLYLARRQATNPNVIVSRISETVVGMRARSSSAEVTALTTVLGTAPVGITH